MCAPGYNKRLAMGKQTKNPTKLQKKADAASRADDALTKQYSKFDKIDCGSSDDEDTPRVTFKPPSQPLGGKLPVVDADQNLEYMLQHEIQSYMTNGSGMNVGMGKPMTQAEYDEMRRQERLRGNDKDHQVISTVMPKSF